MYKKFSGGEFLSLISFEIYGLKLEKRGYERTKSPEKLRNVIRRIGIV